MQLPLQGIRVVDWTIWQQGPVASLMLGDLGADVIKIEQRTVGDPGRGLLQNQGRDLTIGPKRNSYFECMNRNKRDITLDLGKEKAKEIVFRLVKTADVFIQNQRQGVAERLGVDYETLSKYNPKLIYANCSAFGPRGPSSHEPGLDILGMARSGIMTTIGDPDMPPLMIGAGLADQMGGTLTAYGILVALLARERLGVGQRLDVSLLGSMLWLQYLSINHTVMLGGEFFRHRRNEPQNPLYNYYKCADDRWIALSIIQPDRHWSGFCKVVGIEELEKDPRFENLDVRGQHGAELVAILDRVFASKTRDEWVSRLRAADLLVTPVNTISDLENDPQVVANDYIIEYDHPVLGSKVKMVGIPVQLDQTPGSIRLPAPEFGQHTEEILLEIGYSWKEIGKLKEEEVI